MPGLHLRQKVGRSRLVFELQGDLNEGGNFIIEELLSRTRSGPETLNLDLSGVPAIDLRGLTWLLSLERRLHQRGQRLKFLKLNRQVKHILRLVHPAVRPSVCSKSRPQVAPAIVAHYDPAHS